MQSGEGSCSAFRTKLGEVLYYLKQALFYLGSDPKCRLGIVLCCFDCFHGIYAEMNIVCNPRDPFIQVCIKDFSACQGTLELYKASSSDHHGVL